MCREAIIFDKLFLRSFNMYFDKAIKQMCAQLGWWFNSWLYLSTCQSIVGQDTEFRAVCKRCTSACLCVSLYVYMLSCSSSSDLILDLQQDRALLSWHFWLWSETFVFFLLSSFLHFFCVCSSHSRQAKVDQVQVSCTVPNIQKNNGP